jgi:hypothetical protein
LAPFIYLDEFQDVIRPPLEMGDMLAQARRLGAGLVLAHQYLGQLPDGVKTAEVGTARTQIAFQLDSYDDARVLARPFTPLIPDDLLGLIAYEIAMRPAHDRTLGVVTGKTAPLPQTIRDEATLAPWSQQRYGVVRADFEAAWAARITVGNPGGVSGRMGAQRRERHRERLGVALLHGRRQPRAQQGLRAGQPSGIPRGHSFAASTVLPSALPSALRSRRVALWRPPWSRPWNSE